MVFTVFDRGFIKQIHKNRANIDPMVMATIGCAFILSTVTSLNSISVIRFVSGIKSAFDKLNVVKCVHPQITDVSVISATKQPDVSQSNSAVSQ